MNVSQRSESQVVSRRPRSRPDPRHPLFSIGEIAQEFGVSLRTLRFYEDRGLITPFRDGTTRLYSEKDKSRIVLILKGKQLGFSLSEIQDMLAKAKPLQNEEKSLALDPEQIAVQISHLEQRRTDIDFAINELRKFLGLETEHRTAR